MSGETEREPSPWTTDSLKEYLEKRLDGEREYVNSQYAIRDERLNAMDKAAEVLSETIHRVPTDLQEAVGHLRELTDLQFTSIDKQLKIRDDNAERKIRDDKVALEAAFKAQQDAATEQNKSNTLAINKSEQSTKETTDGLRNQIEEVKNRLNRSEQNFTGLVQNRTGGAEERNDRRLSSGSVAAMIGATVGVLGIILAIMTIIIAKP